MIAAAIMALVGLLVLMVYSGSTAMWFTTSERIDLHHSVRRAVNRIALEVRMARDVQVPSLNSSSSSELNFEDVNEMEVEYTFDSATGEIRRNGELVTRGIEDFQVTRMTKFEIHLLIRAKERNQEFSVEQEINLRNIQDPKVPWEDWFDD